MVAPFAQVHREVEVERAARAEEQRRPRRRQPRAVRGDQHVGAKARAFPLAHGAQARRPRLLARLEEDAHVEAEPAARFQNACERRQVHAVLALVVGGAAAVPAIAVDGEAPRREAVPPLRVVPQHDVAVTVGEDRRQRVVLVPLGDQERSAGSRMAREAPREIHRGERGTDVVLQVAAKIGSCVGALAFRPPRDAARELRLEMARVEPRQRGVDDVGPALHDAKGTTPAWAGSACRGDSAAALLPGRACRDKDRRRARRRGRGASRRCGT